MVFELHIAGPGLDVVRRIAGGDVELVLGRDPECDVCLPDPERTVSRRHLSLWLEQGELRFHVLSVVNGIEMPFGEAPPGARGILPGGQGLKVGDYTVQATLIEQQAPVPKDPVDPWAVLEADSSRTGTAVPASPAARGAPPVPQEDDPFGEWGFETTFGPGVNSGGGLEAGSLEAGDARSFFRGLGMDGGAMTQGELEAIGRMVRLLVLGVLDLHRGVAGVKEDLHAEDRTMLAPRETNPLKSNWSAETKLRYLFGGRLAAAGLPPPERAMRELLVDLVTHNAASAAAARQAVEGILKEFAPAELKARLLGDGPKLFEGTRTWDAYCKYFEEQGIDMQAWSQRLMEKYFADAYMRESVRIGRETRPR